MFSYNLRRGRGITVATAKWLAMVTLTFLANHFLPRVDCAVSHSFLLTTFWHSNLPSIKLLSSEESKIFSNIRRLEVVRLALVCKYVNLVNILWLLICWKPAISPLFLSHLRLIVGGSRNHQGRLSPWLRLSATKKILRLSMDPWEYISTNWAPLPSLWNRHPTQEDARISLIVWANNKLGSPSPNYVQAFSFANSDPCPLFRFCTRY